MAKISTYPIVSTPTVNDLLIGTDVENLNETKNFAIGDIGALIIGGTYVPYTGANANVDLGLFSIEASSFILPGGLSTQFLKADGSLDSTTYQVAGNYITSLSGEATASGPGVANVTLNNGAVIGKVLTGLTVTGGSISATDSILQAFGKLQNQVNSLYGGAIYQGTWNASTNTPTLTSSVGTKGYYYIVNVAGNTVLNGISDWNVGDWAIFDGTAWQQVDNTDTVVSVNGKVGVVVLTTTDINEGTNLYYTDGRSRASIGITTSGNSGPSTYNNISGILNVPNYTLSGLGGVPSTRELTINGTTFDLSLNRSWSVGTVTSIGTSGPITGGTITGSGTIGITQSGAASNGYLSSTDWNTFNNKQNALTNPVTGTGTLYYLPMWTGVSALGNSVISQGADTINFNFNTPTGSTINYINTNGVNYTYAIQMNNFGTRQTYHSYTDGNIIQRIGVNEVSKNLSTGQLVLPNYTSVTSFTGTNVGYLGFDASGNILTVTAPSLAGYVPYTGATTNVNLGEFGLTAGQLTLDLSPTGTAVVGTTRWNDTFGGSETLLKGGTVFLKNGVDLVARVVNKVFPNATLTKAAYQAVRISGAQGQRLAVAYAQADADPNSADTLGLVCETIPTNQEGFIITVGQLENINTTGSLQGETWVDGDVLYLSPTTPGAITNIKPVAPQHLVVIGYVEYAHAINGKIYVKVMNGWELGELHDVNTVGAVAGQVLKYNGTIWTPSADAGITGSGVAGQVAYWNGTNSQTGSNNLFWDAANARLGIKNNTPSAVLDVVGSNIISDTTNAFKVIGGSTTLKGNFSTSLGNSLVVTNFNNVVGLSVNGANQVFADNMLIGSGTYITSTGAGYIFTITHDNNGIAFGNSAAATRPYSFNFGASERFRISNSFNSFPNGNLLVGGTSDGGQRLQVYGDAFVRGSGNTSATFSLTIQDSASANILRVRNDKTLIVNSTDTYNGSILAGANVSGRVALLGNLEISSSGGPGWSGQGIEVVGANRTLKIFGTSSLNALDNSRVQFANPGAPWTRTSGISNDVEIQGSSFAPTSGNATYTTLAINQTINQTGGANGITRGLYVNPTITAAADWRSIEWSNNSGWGLYGAGTAPSLLNGALTINNGLLQSGNAIVRVENTGGVAPTGSTGIGLELFKSGSISYIESYNRTTSAYSQLNLRGSTMSFTGNSTFVNDVIINGNISVGTTLYTYLNRLGIGTATPASRLEIANGANQRLTMDCTGSINGAFIQASNNTTAQFIPLDFFANYYTFQTGTGTGSFPERMRLTAAGRLLLGLTAESTFLLDVNGTARVSGAMTISGLITAPSGLFASGVLDIYSDGSNGAIAMRTLTNTLCLRKYVKVLGDDGGFGNNNASAAFQIDGTNRGFLPPRMTTTQKNAIATPAAGLQVYDSTTNAPNYYDGTAWVAMGGGGGASIYTADGTLTSDRTVSSGGFSLIFNPQTTYITTLTASTGGSSYSVLGSNTLSFASGFSSSNIGNVYSANGAINLQTFAGSADFAQANLASAMVSVNSIDFSAAGATITMTQAGGIRAMTGHQSQIQYQGTNSGTITHAAVSQNLGFYRPSAATGVLTITNAYSLLINNLNDYGSGFTFTNRWGIYQDGASDNNYFRGKVIIGSTNTVGASPLNVKNLPTSATGLATGDVWNNGGVLNII